MAWNQTKAFNQSKAGKDEGWCLRNVRNGYGIGSKYDNAIGAWNGQTSMNHADGNIPTGVDVPLYYTYKKDGHVNVRLADGRVWSDGKLFPNLNAYLAAKQSVKYLGWSEAVNNVRVISYTLEKPAPPQPGGSSLRINTGTWNTRTAPNTSAAVVGGGRTPVLGGQQYAINQIDGNGWANITFTGKSAWIGPKVFTRI